MRTFKEYRDQPNFGCWLDEEFDSWLIAPFGRHRDSGTLDRSNFECGVKALKKAEPEDGDDYRFLRFNHWAVGWVEIVIVRPGSKCAEVAAEIETSLVYYPVVDDDHLSDLEWQEYHESWADWGFKDFCRDLRKEFGINAAYYVLEDCDKDVMQEFYESLRPSGEYYIAESSGISILTDHAAKDCTRAQLAAFLRKIRTAQRATP